MSLAPVDYMFGLLDVQSIIVVTIITNTIFMKSYPQYLVASDCSAIPLALKTVYE
jgi:hypothetical protein